MKDSSCRSGSPAGAAILLAAAALAPAFSEAHHSSAMFDDKQTVTIEGAVTKFEWSNPHVYIYVKQRTNTGESIDWEIEASPPSILRRLGWSQDTLHPGDTITVSGSPARDASRKSLHPNLIKHGDTTLFDRKGEVARLASAGSEPPSAPSDAGMAGVWVTLLAPKVEAQLDTDKLSMTAEGKAAVKRFDEKKMHPGANCVPNPAPVFMITPDLKRITKTDKAILVDGEFDGAQRTIHMDVSTHEGATPSIQGHSIGRWEGKTLVIDTALFTYHVMGNSYGLPSGTQKHLVERLTPDGKGGLTYHFVLTDPQYLAAPVEGDVQWVFRPSLAYAPPKCDLDNAKRFAQ
ncbi:MAG TPA: DUF6152 family protein [Steroidobacteraceae bacterium]|jgi:hypothetical protein